MIKVNVVHPCNGLLFSSKSNEVQIHGIAWVNFENTLKPDTKDHVLSLHIYLSVCICMYVFMRQGLAI